MSAVFTERLSGRPVTEPAFAQRVPYPAYVDDLFLTVVPMSLFFLLSFCYSAITMVTNVVVEKEKRLKVRRHMFAYSVTEVGDNLSLNK